jgi:endonuclease/exonuclease/phosphatase family metal-dependent hydrolase
VIKSRIAAVPFLSCFVLSLSIWAEAQASSISVMSYNIENLFDLENDPRISDDEFTPSGAAEWTEEKLHQKLQNLSKVVTAVRNEDGSRCPDVLGLMEVENREILEHWRTNYLSECRYRHLVINRHTDDEPVRDDVRGIKVALLSKLKLGGQPAKYLAYEGGRYILEVPLELNGRRLVVLVNHWKSRIGGGEDKRALGAQTLRSRFEEWNQIDPYTDIVAMGDFNDEPEDASFVKTLGLTSNRNAKDEDLSQAFIWNTSFDEFNLKQKLQEAQELIDLGEPIKLEEVEKFWRQKRGTYYFHRESKFLQLDHLLISRGLLDSRGFQYIPKSFRVIQPLGFTDQNGAPIPYKSSKRGAVGGASDHFPIMIRLNY